MHEKDTIESVMKGNMPKYENDTFETVNNKSE